MSVKLLESGVLDAVTEYLDLRERQGDLVWSLTDPASKDPKERGRRVRKGWADITVCVRGGRFLGIELKRPGKARTSPEQLEFRERVNRLGGVAVECRSVAEVKVAIDDLIRFTGR
jgi:hypothetical protein